MTTIPSDPLFSDQWHLYNPGGLDINVVKVWDDYTGAGVLVGVIDSGFDYYHPDLDDNYDTTIDYDYKDNDSNPFGTSSDSHGTSVIGLIGAEAFNGIGGVGVAFDSIITGYRADRINSFTNALWDSEYLDVVNNSWGFSADFFTDNFNNSSYSSAGQAIQNAVNNGRGGLGTAIVFAAGNNRTDGQNTNYHNFQNSRHVITVAAVDENGYYSDYSTPGASILVSAFGSTGTVVTTDRTGSAGYEPGDYNYGFNGTSAAAPMVSGVVALMLEANPNLGYRDIQEILAYSARKTGSSSSYETNGANNWNGGGLHVSHDYGFGLVDALAAVRLAETWQAQSTYDNEDYLSSGTQNIYDYIPDGGYIFDSVYMNDDLQIDFVEVEIDLEHGWGEDLFITLTSPEGTESVLMDRPNVSGGSLVFTFSSSQFWGENSEGSWDLTVYDDNWNGYYGELNTWKLKLYGDTDTSSDTYIYTNEFANYTTSSRRTLTDTSGTDTINAAAITSNTSLNLTPGSISTLAGNSLTISSSTTIEKAFTGDGNDSIIGNSASNSLNGGRGNDTIDGGAGNDTLIGGGGVDFLKGGIDNDSYTLNALTAGGSKIQDISGTDVLVLSNLTLSLLNIRKSTASLLIDLNLDGQFISTQDLTILDFFGTTGAGSGFIETVDNLSGSNILNSFNPNQAPTNLTLSNSNIAENQPTGTAIGNVSTTDPDTGNTFTYSLVAGTGSTDNALFTIQNNQLKSNAIFNYETKNSYSIRIKTTDQGGLSYEKVLAINVTNINEAPTNLTLSNSNIAENQPTGTVIGNLSATDPDTGNTFTYSLVTGTGSTDNALFTIQNNQLKTNAVFDYETKNSYSIRVKTTDQGGLSYEKPLTINVSNVNETPTQPSLKISNSNPVTIVEGSATTTNLAFTVSLSAASTQTVTVNYTVGDYINGGDGNDLLILNYSVGDTGTGMFFYVFLNSGGSGAAYRFLSDGSNNDLDSINFYGIEQVQVTGTSQNDSLTGGTSNDTLTGGTGNDNLFGVDGNDILNGGYGNDYLVGGTGSDRFSFNSRTEGIDRITDFSVIDDTIAVSAAGFGGGLLAGAAITAAQFRIGTAATTTSQRFIYNNTTGGLFFDQDGTGATAQTQFATLNTGLAMTNADIFVLA